MKHTLKIFIIYFIAFFTLFIGSQYLLENLFPKLDHLYKLIICWCIYHHTLPKS